ncbi:hypothetical protein V6N13_082446 [Hibiscus sabdariffa]
MKSKTGANEQQPANGGSRYVVLSRDLTDNQGDRVSRLVLEEQDMITTEHPVAKDATVRGPKRQNVGRFSAIRTDFIRNEAYLKSNLDRKKKNNAEKTSIEIVPTRERVATKVVNHVPKALTDSHTAIQIVEHDAECSDDVGKGKKSTCGSKIGGVEITRKGLRVRKSGDTRKSKSGSSNGSKVPMLESMR